MTDLLAERSGFMERIEISLNGASLRRAYALWLSLALFFGWVSIGASMPGSQASQLCLRATAGLAFLACSLPPLRSLLHRRSSSLAACMVCAGLSIVFRTTGTLWGVDVLLICAGGVTGVGFALFARLWFGRYRGNGPDLLGSYWQAASPAFCAKAARWEGARLLFCRLSCRSLASSRMRLEPQISRPPRIPLAPTANQAP